MVRSKNEGRPEGRYDTFFFVAKNVYFTAIAAILLDYAKTHRPSLLALAPGMALIFCGTEYLFRYFYWSGYIVRVEQIRKSIKHPILFQRNYLLKVGQDFGKSFHFFDLIYYLVPGAIILMYIMIHFSHFAYFYDSLLNVDWFHAYCSFGASQTEVFI